MTRKKRLSLHVEVPTTPERSRIMAAIKGKGNKSTELRLISIMKMYGIKGWRRNYKLQGKPDFVFPQLRMALFVDGCFWHGCHHCYKEPKKNVEFWKEKMEINLRRDRRNSRQLRKMGWSVARIWEHSLKSPETIAKRILTLIAKRRNT